MSESNVPPSSQPSSEEGALDSDAHAGGHPNNQDGFE
jgi:hypothetical protein